ncbi:MAG: cytochrome C oxidase subunit IV family protein [Herminiimonas sp.]|nr:cytochrome C oxidase subunit IV family protein [Herminiimonas sp.]MDO9422470.1 cytochrome C oxidase subunit IV family protein [Herminiimonas sp.]
MGFILCAVLTVIPFGLVMFPMLSRPLTLLFLVGFAVMQRVYFLHLNRSSEGCWK